ncbi:hypothetical protein [Escherichia coli]|uniref:hypothetical protein n=1 Tax=Escherichia coli TaxID=562 RepID=UPI001F0D590D|nr:hypothetical protein [Escherichia coli]UMR72098.1 hypothetical protein AOY94_17645 [Escherichia coli]
MKQMSLIEMDGFLKGKCIPRDLKVNETNAEYLVRKFAEAQAKCAALAAENAGLKSEAPLGAIENGRAFADRLENYQFECEGGNLNMCSDWQEFRRCFEYLSEWVMHSQTEHPATDAFLAEVRAQGVDAAIEAAKNLVVQEYEYKDFKAAQSDCCMHPGSDLVGKVEMTEWLVDFAAQLRKGGNQ